MRALASLTEIRVCRTGYTYTSKYMPREVGYGSVAPLGAASANDSVGRHNSTRADEGRKKRCVLLAIKMLQGTYRSGEGGEEPHVTPDVSYD